ncbi:hypothetical protein Tco_0457345 [Tanacetum coccineum]
MTSVHNSSGLNPQCQMTSVHNSSGLNPQCQMASDHVSSDPGPQCSTTVLEHDSLSPGPQSQENVPQIDDNEFINIFSTPVQEQGETSSRHVDSSNMHTFCNTLKSEYAAEC